MKPFFSIITCTLNSEKTLKRNLESVQFQIFKDYEHIFIDGYSTDNTLKIIKEYQQYNQDKIKVFQLPPKGIANAFNEGIKRANGEYLIHLNSDDWFYDNKVLEDVYIFLKNNKNLDWIYGKVNFYDIFGNNLNIIKPNKIFQFKKPGFFAKYLLKFFYYIPHQAVFIKKNVFEKLGYFDEFNFPVLPDLEFFTRIRNKTKWCFYDRIIANFTFQKDSERSKETIKKFNEIIWKIRKKYLTPPEFLLLYIFLFFLWLKKKIK